MADQTPRSLTDIEKEAANSYREWPIYIVMRLKRLQAIQEKLRVDGRSPTSILRREELLKAVYDQEAQEQGAVAEEVADDDASADSGEAEAVAAKPAKGKASKASAGGAKAKAKASSEEDSEYLDDVNYD